MTVQIISGQQQSFAGRPMMIPSINAFGNPGHYFEPPGPGYIIQPPPYSPAKRTAAPPPYVNGPEFAGNNYRGMPPPPPPPIPDEKDNKEIGLSVIHPMQPAYYNQGGTIEGVANYPHQHMYDNPPTNMYGNFTGNGYLSPNYQVGPPGYPGSERTPTAVQSRNDGGRTPGVPVSSPAPSQGHRTPIGNMRPPMVAMTSSMSTSSRNPRTPLPGPVPVPGPVPGVALMETRHM